MRSCCCTGYLNNPGGVCCMDMTYPPQPSTVDPPPPPAPQPVVQQTFVVKVADEEILAQIDAITHAFNALLDRLERVEARLGEVGL